jgi:hypothetical protein
VPPPPDVPSLVPPAEVPPDAAPPELAEVLELCEELAALVWLEAALVAALAAAFVGVVDVVGVDVVGV